MLATVWVFLRDCVVQRRRCEVAGGEVYEETKTGCGGGCVQIKERVKV